MDITNLYLAYFEAIKPILVMSGILSLTISVIVMLINMVISSFTGKGLHIGSR